MEDEISAGGTRGLSPERLQQAFVPMKVGGATVYVEQSSVPAIVEEDDRIRPVAPDPREVFESASEILRECVRVVGERVEAIAERAAPRKVTVEFSLSFKATGKATLIPIFVTGETGAEAGLKVTAVWQRQGVINDDKS